MSEENQPQIPPGGKAPTTDVISVLSEVQAGVLLTSLSYLLTQLAISAVELDKVGEVSLVFKVKRNGDSKENIILDAILSHKTPDSRGYTSQKSTYKTPMFVGRNGALSITPETMKFDLVGGGNPRIRAT